MITKNCLLETFFWFVMENKVAMKEALIDWHLLEKSIF
jgi:hypothetical protein